jgi:hypothetical protein
MAALDGSDDLLSDSGLIYSLMVLDGGTLQNAMQAALENEGTLYERLAKGYYEVTAKGFDPNGIIGLKDGEQDQ